MSYVTSVILLCSGVERDRRRDHGEDTIHSINRWLEEEEKGKFNEISDQAGGHRGIAGLIYAGAFNHLDIDEFMQLVKAAPWVMPERVQILIKGEEDNVWGLLNLIAPLESREASYETRRARKALGRGEEDEPFL